MSNKKELHLTLAEERKRLLENLLEGFKRVQPTVENYIYSIEQFIRVETLVIQSINESEGTADNMIEMMRDTLIKRLCTKAGKNDE